MQFSPEDVEFLEGRSCLFPQLWPLRRDIVLSKVEVKAFNSLKGLLYKG